jgi:uncharacterized membrane protein YqhA
MFKKLEDLFEVTLWNFRFFVLLPVIFGLLSTLKLFVIGTLDIWEGIMLNFDRKDPEGEITYKIISYIIGGIDYYLIGIVLLIFSFGIYELFISKIDIRFQKKETNILQIASLEQLKGKIIQVIVVALIVSVFKKMLNLDIKSAIDIVYLALSILLISVSSYLMHLQYHNQHSEKEN